MCLASFPATLALSVSLVSQELAGRARERPGQVLHMCAGVRFHQELPILCTVD